MHGVMRGVVDSIALPLAHRHDKDEELMVTHLADQTVPGGPQLDLVAVAGSTQFARGDPGLSQPLSQPVLERRPDSWRQLPPLPKGFRVKGQLKGHQG
jgi:hypothetical protein